MSLQRFLVTGGSKGIGESIVRLARGVGHEVVFTGRDAERVERVAAETGARGLAADVVDAMDNERTVVDAMAAMGGIDVLINNAAIGYGAPIGEIDMGALRRQYDVNLFGLIDLTNRVVPHMRERQSGDIVNIASTSGIKGHANGTAYSGSKWALRGISQCWQAELRPDGIRVICVCPSEVQTGFSGGVAGSNQNKLFAEDIAGAVMGCLSMNRRGFIPEFAVFATNPWGD